MSFTFRDSLFPLQTFPVSALLIGPMAARLSRAESSTFSLFPLVQPRGLFLLLANRRSSAASVASGLNSDLSVLDLGHSDAAQLGSDRGLLGRWFRRHEDTERAKISLIHPLDERSADLADGRISGSEPRCGDYCRSRDLPNDQHAPFSDNVANRRYDRNLSCRHRLTRELVLPDERRGQPLGPSLVSVVIRAFTKRVIYPA